MCIHVGSLPGHAHSATLPCFPRQTNNEDAIRFYQNFGFESGEVVKDYYRRIEPPDAVILRKLPPFDSQAPPHSATKEKAAQL